MCGNRDEVCNDDEGGSIVELGDSSALIFLERETAQKASKVGNGGGGGKGVESTNPGIACLAVA